MTISAIAPYFNVLVLADNYKLAKATIPFVNTPTTADTMHHVFAVLDASIASLYRPWSHREFTLDE